MKFLKKKKKGSIYFISWNIWLSGNNLRTIKIPFLKITSWVKQTCRQKCRGQVSEIQNQNQIYFQLPLLLVFMLEFWHSISDVFFQLFYTTFDLSKSSLNKYELICGKTLIYFQTYTMFVQEIKFLENVL